MTDQAEPTHCDLCGVRHEPRDLARALLREPWSNARVAVPRVCSACRSRAWRTIEQPAPVEIVVPDDVPLVMPRRRRRSVSVSLALHATSARGGQRRQKSGKNNE